MSKCWPSAFAHQFLGLMYRIYQVSRFVCTNSVRSINDWKKKNASGCWLLWKLCRIKWTQENFCLYIFHHIFDGISISVLCLCFLWLFWNKLCWGGLYVILEKKNPVTFVDVIFHHKPKQMARNPFPLDWCKLTGAYISEQVKSKLLTEFEALTPPPLNGPP